MMEKRQEIGKIHLSDQELLQAADGELPARRADQVHAHLAACWDCRARMGEIEQTIADFARAHRRANSDLPPIDGPRSLLLAQLGELAAHPPAHAWWPFRFDSFVRTAAVVTVALFLVAIGGVFFVGLVGHKTAQRAVEPGAEPNRILTPGATRPVRIDNICSMPREEVVSEVTPSLRQQVFREYGISNPRPEDYEIDYLIAPGLGGTEELHNLWPEPSTARIWNAHVKDTLEEHLHEMVCAGQIDLPTAQREIATDWIAAYKKYFHTNAPLALRSSLSVTDQMGALGPFRD
ncbi:MAG TPA: hypothetical protein VMT67_01915 [Terriglobales bacterium]|nr:hypothetical protein [Terriglobales bacterium]